MIRFTAAAGATEAASPESAREPHIAPVPRISIQAFCESPETTAVVQGCGDDRRMSKAHLKVQTGGIAAAVEAYRTSPTPNVIVIESQSRGDDLLAGLDTLAEVCDAGTRVIIIGRHNDIVLYRELVRRGVSDYLMAPISPLDLIRAVSSLFTAPDAKPVGRLVAVVGAKGGVGASTIAHNVAWAIARNLLAAPATLDRVYDFGPEAFDAILDILRTSVPCIVLDVPHMWTGWSKRALVAADDILIVACPDLANLRNAKNLIDVLRVARPNDYRPHYCLNQVGVPKRPELKPADFAKALEVQPTAVIPFEPQLFGTAANNGQMIAEMAANHRTTETFRQLAQLLTGRAEVKRSRNLLAPFINKLKRRA